MQDIDSHKQSIFELKVKTYKNSYTSTTEDILYAKSYKAVEDKRA